MQYSYKIMTTSGKVVAAEDRMPSGTQRQAHKRLRKTIRSLDKAWARAELRCGGKVVEAYLIADGKPVLERELGTIVFNADRGVDISFRAA